MTEGKIQTIATIFQASLFAVAGLNNSNNLVLLVYLASGAVGGALIGALGGKKFGILDLGVSTVLGKVAAHFAVVLGLGPALLDYVLHRYPTEVTGITPAATASATGFLLALCGTTALIMLIPIGIALLKNLLTAVKWLPQETKTTTISPSLSAASTPASTTTPTASTNSNG